MARPFLSFGALVFFCGHLASMEPETPQIGDQLYFNIGGYKMDVSRQTVEQFGGPYLNALISGQYGITYDRKVRIFIDRPKEEGKLIAYFMRTQQLPANCDETHAKSAADFFGLEGMLQCIDHRNPKMSILKRLFKAKLKYIGEGCCRHNKLKCGYDVCKSLRKFPSLSPGPNLTISLYEPVDTTCPECNNVMIIKDCFEAIAHLIDDHQAKIEDSYRSGPDNEWGVLYRVPIASEGNRKASLTELGADF